MSAQLDEGQVHAMDALDAARTRSLEQHEIELLRLYAAMSLQSRRQLLKAAREMTLWGDCSVKPAS